MKDAESSAKVLIVDDSRTIRQYLTQVLCSEYEIITASCGADAVVQAVEHRPSLILLDVVMPDMNGYEVCRRLKSDPATGDIPIIFLTSLSSADDELRGLEIGAVDYITKPIQSAIARARVRAHVELKQKTDLLESISVRDGLTGIFNRRQFDRVLQTEWNRAMRSGYPLSLVLLDLDDFKAFNDNYGHLAGDHCLQRAAETLQTTLRRASDFLARYGGEEFAVILPDTDREQAATVAKNLCRAVETLEIPHDHSAAAAYVTISAGAASMVPPRGEDSAVLIAAADQALYKAKHGQGNQVQLADAEPSSGAL